MSDQHEQHTNDALQAFQQDPATFMNQLPQKRDAQGNPVQGKTLFSKQDIASRDYISVRDAGRHALYRREEISEDRAAYAANDKAEYLVDKFVHSSLEAMEKAKLRSAKLAESPWSDDYWGLYAGSLGKRYADPDFPQSGEWLANFNYIRNHHPLNIFKSGSAAAIAQLSPAEKFDALVGDTNGSLTRRMWSDGKYFHDANGSVEAWMGICHGWAPAAYMLGRPKKAITVQAYNTTPITFYPSDIKALASLLWANAATQIRFIGGRCNDKSPATDNEGRIISADCFDTNPGTWHMAVVNQIGAAKRSMVLDATYDYEVWNQPTYAYEYRYFNPSTLQQTDSLGGATIARSNFANDRFKKYRSPQAAYLVGVAMQVSYVVETSPSHTNTDSPDEDAINQVEYLYDLELDANKKIIGGEWYTNYHPDFLWTPPPGVHATTRYDHLATGSWLEGRPVPQNWQLAARQASASDGAPLAAIVEKLIEFSRH